MCKTCNAIHNYRKPKSLTTKKSSTKPATRAKKTTTRKTTKKPAQKWEDLIAQYDLSSAQDYSMKQNYEETAIIRHKSFGIGIVAKKVGQTKIEVKFELGDKLLITNKK